MNRRQQSQRRRTRSVSSVCSARSLAIRSGKDRPRYSVGSLEDIEVDDQSQRDIEQFHVAEQLRLMEGKNFFDAFAFYKQTAIDEQIKAKWQLASKLCKQRKYLSVVSVVSCSFKLLRR